MKTSSPVLSADPRKLVDRFERRFKRMSAQEKAQTLVDAGIMTPKHRIKAPYREALAGVGQQ